MSNFNVFYIASESERDRVQFMESWLSNTDCIYSRVDGVTIESSYNITSYDRERRLGRFGFDMTDSEIGCFLAHRKIWRLIGESGRPALILESDCYLNREISLSALLRELLAHLAPMEMVRLHGIFERNEVVRRKIRALDQGFDFVQCLGDPMGGLCDGLARLETRRFGSATVLAGGGANTLPAFGFQFESVFNQLWPHGFDGCRK